MKKQNVLRYMIIAGLVIAWMYVAFINRAIVIEPVRKYLGNEYTFVQTRDDITRNYIEKFKEKYWLVNLNGLFTRISGGRMCNDVIRLKNGSLTSVNPSYDTRSNAGKTIELCNALEKRGIDFLYVQSPFKTNSELLPYGLVDETDNNVNIFLGEINGKVPYIDLRPYFTDDSEYIDQFFYRTDHHWNPLGAFKAFQIISDYLQSQYPDEEINGDCQNIENWEMNKKENWFLGSRGKRTGTYFGGVDDLIWMTPMFNTEMSCMNVYRDEFYCGDFSDANIREKFILQKDYFGLNSYCVYIGGDYPLVQHRNLGAPVDKKILIIKDSFVLPLQAFFSTVFNEVDVIDLRHYKAGTLYEYIEESNPDLVTMCLNGNCVTIDDFFDMGIKERKVFGVTDQILRNDLVTIMPDDDNAYNNIPICDKIGSGKRYSLVCDSVIVDQGCVDGISIKLYDKTSSKVYDCVMWDLNYCEKSDSYEWTFTAPEDAGDYVILVYAGIAGQTKGNGITLQNVRVLRE